MIFCRFTPRSGSYRWLFETRSRFRIRAETAFFDFLDSLEHENMNRQSCSGHNVCAKTPAEHWDNFLTEEETYIDLLRTITGIHDGIVLHVKGK